MEKPTTESVLTKEDADKIIFLAGEALDECAESGHDYGDPYEAIWNRFVKLVRGLTKEESK
jgi:hypothetical protein